MAESRAKIQLTGKSPGLGDEGLHQWLLGYMTAHPHHDLVVLSREQFIGISRTSLDDYIKGIYFLPVANGGRGHDPKNSKIEAAIRRFREQVEGTVRHGYANTFMETKAYYRLEAACNTAIRENVIVVAYGKPGVGKTRGLTQYATAKMKSTLPVQVLCSANVTTRYFIRKLARGLGIDDRPTTAQLEDLIAEKLKRSPRPIFVDQANFLNEKALGSICYIWDIARVPVVLVGTHDLYELFTTSSLTEDVRAQLSSRVAMHYPLNELLMEETKQIVQRALGEEATAEVIAAIINVTGGIHRHVDMILPRINEMKEWEGNAARLASGELSLVEIIEAAGRRLMTG